MTNNSGKFLIMPISGYSQSMNNPETGAQRYVGSGNQDPDPNDPPASDIPPCPSCNASPMDTVKRLFGECWWVWLSALLVIWLYKE